MCCLGGTDFSSLWRAPSDRSPSELSIALICSLVAVVALSLALVDRDEEVDSADEEEADDNDEAVEDAEELRSLAIDLSECEPGASIC